MERKIALKFSAIVLTGLMVSGVALAEESKYFECKVTEWSNPWKPDDNCGEKNGKTCSRVQQWSFEKFQADGTTFKLIDHVGDERSIIVIDRINGTFTRSVENPNGMKATSSGVCELKTKKLKF